MKFRQEYQDSVADALQGAKMPRETVGKVITLLDHIFDAGDNVEKTVDDLLKQFSPKKKKEASA